jgi:magnesium chelatase family protein
MTSLPTSGPGAARIRAAAVIGVNGYFVEARAESGRSPASFAVLGLPGAATRETRDRVRAAVLNTGLPWPARAITVSLFPDSLPKHGSGFDLPIAIAVLTAAGVIPEDAGGACVFIGELGLDGSLHPVRGVLPALIAAANVGCTRAVVPAGNAAEAMMVPGLAVAGCRSLRAVLAWLHGEPPAGQPEIPALGIEPPGPGVRLPGVSLAGVGAAPLVRLAAEASAAGGHHLCLAGPRGTGIPALAAGLAALLLPLSPEEVLEVSAIYSVAGLLGPGRALITRAPFRAPHHTATPAAIAGGGSGTIRPGEAALAHRGVLFLDEAPEFARSTLAVLRQPLQDGGITIARSGRTVWFPARFTLVAGMAPCPCGSPAGCGCTPLQQRRYRARLTGELGSYISIWLDAARSVSAAHVPGGHAGDADAISAARVAGARDRAWHRFRDTPWQLNGDIPGAELRRSLRPSPEVLAPVNRAVDLGEISARAAGQVIRVAWTLADLDGSDRPGPQEYGQALAFQLGVAR